MRKLLLAFLVSGLCAAAGSALSDMDGDLGSRIQRGIDAVHNIQFDLADKEFQGILDNYPGQPYGYFGLALTAWGRLEYEHEQSSDSLNKLFQQKMDFAISKGDEWLDKHPKDAYGCLCVGGMYGIRSRLAVMKHSWLSAYFDGRRGLKLMKKALKLNPELYDAYLGPGLYEYYAGTLPGVVKVLAKLLVSGDAEKGIEYLKLVKDKGRFNKTAAQLLLIEIYTQTGSKYENPLQALEWAKELRLKYPGHPLIHFVEIVTLYESGKWPMVRAEAEDYLKKINDNAPYYRKIYIPRAYIALATSYLAEHQWAPAAENFILATQAPSDTADANRWVVWAFVRLGNVYDLENKRDLALAAYKKALAFDDKWGFKSYIKRFLSKPYTLAELPGQLPPP